MVRLPEMQDAAAPHSAVFSRPDALPTVLPRLYARITALGSELPVPSIFRISRVLVARPGGKSGTATLFLMLALPWLGWPRPGIPEPESDAGTVILVGDVLPLNQRNVWSRIVGQAPDLVIIAAASGRPKLYGGFARRALERHGAFAELLPVAVDPAEFGVDHRRATGDPALVGKIREAAGVFFVGGAPQRLAEVLFRPDGSPTPMAAAVAEVYAAGGAVVGGHPGSHRTLHRDRCPGGAHERPYPSRAVPSGAWADGGRMACRPTHLHRGTLCRNPGGHASSGSHAGSASVPAPPPWSRADGWRSPAPKASC